MNQAKLVYKRAQMYIAHVANITNKNDKHTLSTSTHYLPHITQSHKIQSNSNFFGKAKSETLHQLIPFYQMKSSPPLFTLKFLYYVIFTTKMMLHMLCLASSSALHPIILVPGSGGNILEARLTPNYKASTLICKLYPGRLQKDKDGWYRIWFDPSVVLAPYTKCFAERMMLYYDPVSDDYFNAPGVETRVPHFGSTQSLLYLDPNLK